MERRYNDIRALYESGGNYGLSDFGVSAEGWCLMPRVGRRAYLAIDAGPIYDDYGELIAVVETLRDITAQKRAQIDLEALATRDGLTGLANRRSFDVKFGEEARRASRDLLPLSLLMIDVDYFKLYNDSQGHQKGDECLRADRPPRSPIRCGARRISPPATAARNSPSSCPTRRCRGRC